MDSRLYKVAKSGNIHFLLHLLNENPSLLTKLTPQGNTPLHIAVQFGHKGVVVEIYNRCRSLLTRLNSNGDSPLHVAARCGHFSIVGFLVKEVVSAKRISTQNGKTSKFDVLRQGNKDNNTILHEAVMNGNISVVQLLLRVDPELACFENYAGQSPLFLAAREGKKDILDQILISTPPSAHGGSEGQTALHAAVIERHSDIMEILLREKPQLIREADHHLRTPLYYAASLGDHKAVERLLEFDTCIAYALDRDGRSALHVAAKNGHAKVVERIIYYCPDSGELLDLNGRSVLHFAVLSGKVNVVRCVLETAELQCLVNQVDNGGNTPLHLAAIEKQTWIMLCLIWDERVDQRARNVSGQSVFDIDESIRESCFTYRCNIITSIWRKLSSVSNGITKKKNPRYCTDHEAIARTQTYKRMGHTLLMVATLIATVTFAAAFTLPGGFDNNLGPRQGVALLDSSKALKWFIITDAIAMTSSIVAACIIFLGVVINDGSYVYYLASATVLTCIALQSAAIAFLSGIVAVLPDQPFVDSVTYIVGTAFHVCIFLFLLQLAHIFLVSEICQFLIFRFWKMKSKINK
ncbi:unnamed protein product [Dovyalis caffra]|uniref:PGG domain-containing protein n=1 Tax=Dovyalis caffra TaxID=77055 RepID=A0AAV1RS40_9ROSI|nr:unnamed protein product [Dovyalis caffra]